MTVICRLSLLAVVVEVYCSDVSSTVMSAGEGLGAVSTGEGFDTKMRILKKDTSIKHVSKVRGAR